MKLAVISCAVFTRLLSRAVADCPNACRVFFLEQGLHNTPARLRGEIQSRVDEIDLYNRSVLKPQRFDTAVLAYGLCSNGVCGVRAGEIPLVIPRTDACIGIFLGSQKRYLDFFDDPGGVYWFNSAWYEQAALPSKDRLELLCEQYAGQHGQDGADWLVRTELDSLRRYRNAIFIREPSDPPAYPEKARQAAEDFGWNYQETQGDASMLSRLLDGEWSDREFLTVPPGETVCPSYDALKITSRP